MGSLPPGLQLPISLSKGVAGEAGRQLPLRQVGGPMIRPALGHPLATEVIKYDIQYTEPAEFLDATVYIFGFYSSPSVIKM